MSHRMHLQVLALLALAAGILVFPAAEVADPAPARYVALGDSYSSGEGVPPFQAGTDRPSNRCHRSEAAYPPLVAAAAGFDLDFWACSGARIDSIRSAAVSPERPPWDDPLQGGGALRSALDRLGPDVGLVTVTIGGNDAGFGSVMAACALSIFRSCDRLDGEVSGDIAAMGGRLPALYEEIRAAISPQGRILVLGYPRLFPKNPTSFCWVDPTEAGFFSVREQRWANEKATELNTTIRAATEQVAGVEFVDVEEALGAGALCGEGGSRMVGVDLFNTEYSFHPNAAGHRAFADAIAWHLANVPSPMAPPPAPDTPAPHRPAPAPTPEPRPVAVAPAAATIGGFEPDRAVWHLRSAADTVKSFRFGEPGELAMVGDWDCDGIDTPGTYRFDGRVQLRDDAGPGAADHVFFTGQPGDVPLAGDWDGDGCDTVSLYRPVEGRVLISNSLRSDGGVVAVERAYYFGVPGDRPFAGDFDGDGVDTVGLYREATGFAYLRNRHSTGVADRQFFYGTPSDRIVAGDWDGDGDDTVGIFRPREQRFYLSNHNRQGFADLVIDAGSADWLPLAGRFAF